MNTSSVTVVARSIEATAVDVINLKHTEAHCIKYSIRFKFIFLLPTPFP